MEFGVIGGIPANEQDAVRGLAPRELFQGGLDTEVDAFFGIDRLFLEQCGIGHGVL